MKKAHGISSVRSQNLYDTLYREASPCLIFSKIFNFL